MGGWSRMFLAVALGLGAACGGGSGPGGPTETTMVPDAGPAGPFDITIASSPPIELPGTVLWLDADYGVARDGSQVRAWTDRSGLGHIFERQADGDPGPTLERLASHGALHFAGHARMGLSRATDERARAALTLESQDFLIALALRRDGAEPEATLFALAAPGSPTAAAVVRLHPGLELALDAGPTVSSAAQLEGPGPHLVVIVRQGGTLALRVDGQEVASAPAPPAELPYSIPYVGAWDLEEPGFTGLVGDVVLVAGENVEGALAPLEAYLQQKYGL